MTPTITLTPTITPVVVPTESVFEIRYAYVYPNPVNATAMGSAFVSYYITQDSARERIVIYSTAFRKLREEILSGADTQGNRTHAIPAACFDGLGNGMYYYYIEATGPSGWVRSKAKVLVVIR